MPGAEFKLDKDDRINLEQATVLLLEAPKPTTDILAQLFYGYGVRQPIRCHAAAEALDRVMTGEPVDLIVCDADADGQAFDFVRKLRSGAPEPNRFCPVILLLGHTSPGLVAQARDCGANFVVAKPLSPLVLLERIFWVCADKRTFVELPGYAGPDRRFNFLGAPMRGPGRRYSDSGKGSGEVADGGEPSLSQAEIDDFMNGPAGGAE
ncbi:MAG TPA: response regulator [Caulobacteraceae bacterium]